MTENTAGQLLVAKKLSRRRRNSAVFRGCSGDYWHQKDRHSALFLVAARQLGGRQYRDVSSQTWKATGEWPVCASLLLCFDAVQNTCHSTSEQYTPRSTTPRHTRRNKVLKLNRKADIVPMLHSNVWKQYLYIFFLWHSSKEFVNICILSHWWNLQFTHPIWGQ